MSLESHLHNKRLEGEVLRKYTCPPRSPLYRVLSFFGAFPHPFQDSLHHLWQRSGKSLHRKGSWFVLAGSRPQRTYQLTLSGA